MKKIMFFTVFVTLLAVPMASFAFDKIEKCEAMCLQRCSDQGDESHAECMKACMHVCMNHGDTPLSKTETNAAKLYTKNNAAAVTISPENQVSAAPVVCGTANAVKPIIIAEKSSPCPGKVYCNNPNSNCGEYCCEWGYFYSNSCDCKCYRSSDDAGANCSSYFRCN